MLKGVAYPVLIATGSIVSAVSYMAGNLIFGDSQPSVHLLGLITILLSLIYLKIWIAFPNCEEEEQTDSDTKEDASKTLSLQDQMWRVTAVALFVTCAAVGLVFILRAALGLSL